MEYKMTGDDMGGGNDSDSPIMITDISPDDIPDSAWDSGMFDDIPGASTAVSIPFTPPSE